MIAVLLTALFLAAAAMAVWAIGVTLRRYGHAALALPGQLEGCPEWRDVRVRKTELRVIAGSGNILRPRFSAAARPARRCALPAAA